MRLLIVFFLVSLISCITVNHKVVIVKQYKYNYIDSDFIPIVQMFIYEAESRGHLIDLNNLSMTFGSIRAKKTDRTIGYCVSDPIGGMVIKIHTPTWKVMDDYEKEELIFHEMAHCLIGREHCTKVDQDGPMSIMFPFILSGKYYKTHREKLVDELFNINPECVGYDGNANEVNGKVYSPSLGIIGK